MSFEQTNKEAKEVPTVGHNWAAELFERQEHTLGGAILGVARDLLDCRSNPHALRALRAKSNDEIAEIAADTVAFLPSMKWAAGGAIRAAILIDPHNGLLDNGVSFGKNFLEGAALNKAGKLAAPEGTLAKVTTQRFGQGILSECITHMSVGFGMGAVKSGFNSASWLDGSGEFSLGAGVKTVLKSAGLAAGINLPAGMLGVRISKAASFCLSEGAISQSTASLISGVGSGWASGIVFGGLDGLSSGKSWQEVVSSMHKGGLIGAVTGGFVHGFETSKLQSRAEQRYYSLSNESEHVSLSEPAVLRAAKSYDAPIDVESLEFPLRTLSFREKIEVRKRLSDKPIRSQELLLVPREGFAGPFKDYADFALHGRKEISVNMLVYGVEGHTAKIAIPEDYARQLDEVRRLRYLVESDVDPKSIGEDYAKRVAEAREQLARHPLRDRALPEDLISQLDRLPDRSMVRRVNLLDSQYADDAWLGQTYKPGFRAAASASESKEISFYSAERGSESLQALLFHEWSHLLKFRFAQVSKEFDLAAALEKDGYFATDYARRNDAENFAVHLGEDLLHPDADSFVYLGEQAPLRCAVMGKALEVVLKNAPAQARSEWYPQLKERVSYLTENVLPEAQKVLVHKIHSGDLPTKKLAMELLGNLGDDSHLGLLKSTAVKSQDAELSRLALDAALRMAPSANKRLEILLEVGGHDSQVHKLAVERLRNWIGYGEYAKYLEYAGDTSRLPDLVKLVKSMPDAQGRKLAFDEAYKMAANLGDAGTIGTLMKGAPNKVARIQAFEMLLELLTPSRRIDLALNSFSTYPELRKPALEFLARATEPKTEGFLKKVCFGGDPELASLAQEALDSIHHKINVTKMTSSANESVKLAAIAELGQKYDIRVVKPLLESAVTGNEAIRGEAIRVLRTYSPAIVRFEIRQLAYEKPELSGALRVMAQSY